MEEKVKKLFESKLFRGKVFVKVSIDGSKGEKNFQKIEINQNVVSDYMRKIKKIQKNLHIKGELEIRELINFPGVIENMGEGKEDKIWPQVRSATQKAVDKLVVYRKSEGIRLARDFAGRLDGISRSLKQIKKCGKQCVAAYRKKLVGAIRKMEENEGADRNKLETEVALFAKNCDVTEEIIRLGGHLIEYRDAMKKAKTDVGKKLDFIAQEMQREINTIGAKSSDMKIAKAVVEVKSEIEKIREQVKNVE